MIPHEMIIYVVEAFCPGVQSLSLKANDFSTKSILETCLIIATDAAAVGFFFHCVILHMMFPF